MKGNGQLVVLKLLSGLTLGPTKRPSPTLIRQKEKRPYKSQLLKNIRETNII